jgi:tRNA-specific 2-thiouridylase
MSKILIAMSGGVDSSVAAYLVQAAGDECVGCTMKLFDNGDAGISGESTCCSLSDVEDARRVCLRLGMAHHTFNFKDEFRACVMQPFVDVYEAGGTPNPCIECNRALKFDALLRRAEVLGLDGIATGHYARVEKDVETGRYLLKTAADLSKDQTYVLYMLTQEQLARIRFPLGGLTKTEVRAIAEREGFANAHKHDSQDICFIPDGDYGAFLERFTGKTYPAGDFLDEDGNVIGRHRGAVRYTIGQRKGLGLALPAPGYVLAKDMARNTVTVGRGERLFTTRVVVENCNFIPFDAPSGDIRVQAKLRYSQQKADCTLHWDGARATLDFDAPQRAVTPGQAAVFYDGELVVGGGTIV